MSEEKKLAVLIDSDNVSAKYAQYIMQEVSKYGTPTYKRVYGDWEKGGNGWHDAAINYSIMPVQQCSYIAGKNATDFSMIIDAMDILYTGNADGFVLVTSDSDFTRLAIRLREAGKLVIGIGELKTPRAFTISCHHFCYLNQVCEPEGMQDEKTIRRAVVDFVTENEGQRIDLAKISAVLTSRFGNINFSELGYKRFSNFIDSFAELRRSNTFVSLKKKNPPAVKPVQTKADEESIRSAIAEYFSQNKPEHDNMRKIESFLNERFGKIDFSKFGSKRFAKFIDKCPDLTRSGTDISPATKTAPKLTAEVFGSEVMQYISDNPAGANAGQLNNFLLGKYGKGYFRTLGFTSFNAAIASISGVKLENNTLTVATNAEAVAEHIRSFAAACMPDGGIGQLTNELTSKYGKDILAELGFEDMRALLSAVEGVHVLKRRVFTEEQPLLAPKEAEEPNVIESAAEPSAEALAEAAPTEAQPEQHAAEQNGSVPSAEEQPKAKPDLNSVKREVFGFAVSADGKGTVAALGKQLAASYGSDFLAQLGFTSMRKLISEIDGISIKNNRIRIDEAFAQQTEEIEQFVREFAAGEGKHSIRALGIRLKERFEGFDFRSYGFARFTDFINAIDGVRADRYHVTATDNHD